ncbi:MAG: alpha/beta fold hydrolase [Microlunatus sp.]|nr:alpha/beta fold hydrolase [Microlunatus sp.]
MRLPHRRRAEVPPAQVRAGAEAYQGGSGEIGVLLCHGFTGSPASLRPWAEYLVAQGYRVSLPRLPGHGTSWQELNQTGWPDWYAALDRALTELSAQCRMVVVGGLSMGGALALRLAELHAERVAGLVLVNPALNNADPRLVLLPVLKHLTPSVAGIANDIARPFTDEVAYDRTPLKALASMLELWDITIARLHRVHQPILLYRSLHDHVVDPTSVRILHERVHGASITERLLQKSFHVATLDYDADEIFTGSAEFVRALSSELD